MYATGDKGYHETQENTWFDTKQAGETVERINEGGELIKGTAPKKAPSQGEQQSFTFYQRMADATEAMDLLEEEVSSLGIFGQIQLMAAQ